MLSKEEKVQAYLKEFIFVRQKETFKHKTDSYEDWLIELETKKLSELLKSWKSLVKSDFDSYSSKTIDQPTPVIDSKAMYKFCQDRQVIPLLLNRNTCYKLFKECQRSDTTDVHKEVMCG